LPVNRYTGSVHEGKDNGWAIRNGDFYNPSWSQLKDPAGFPLTLKPAQGSPMLITESSWTLPTLHRAEGSFLVSAYGSLTGIGPYFFFINANDEWAQPSIGQRLRQRYAGQVDERTTDELGQFRQPLGWRVRATFRKQNQSLSNSARSGLVDAAFAFDRRRSRFRS
jgi:hypothetical protein